MNHASNVFVKIDMNRFESRLFTASYAVESAETEIVKVALQQVKEKDLAKLVDLQLEMAELAGKLHVAKGWYADLVYLRDNWRHVDPVPELKTT